MDAPQALVNGGWWEQVIQTLCQDPGYLLGALGIVCGLGAGVLISVTAMITEAWQKVRATEELTNLKLRLLEQGLSTDELVKVLSAGGSPRWQAKLATKWQRWAENNCAKAERWQGRPAAGVDAPARR